MTSKWHVKEHHSKGPRHCNNCGQSGHYRVCCPYPKMDKIYMYPELKQTLNYSIEPLNRNQIDLKAKYDANEKEQDYIIFMRDKQEKIERKELEKKHFNCIQNIWKQLIESTSGLAFNTILNEQRKTIDKQNEIEMKLFDEKALKLREHEQEQKRLRLHKYKIELNEIKLHITRLKELINEPSEDEAQPPRKTART